MGPEHGTRRAMGGAMRILLASNLFPPDVLGGYELLADDVARALRERGHDVHVITTGAPRETDPGWVHRGLNLVRPFGEPPARDRLRHAWSAHQHRRVVDEVLRLEGPFDAALFLSQRRLGLHVARALQAHGVPGVWLFNDDWLLAHAPGDGATPLRSKALALLERGPLSLRTWAGVRFERAIHVSGSIERAMRDGGVPLEASRVVWQGVDLRVFSPRDARDARDVSSAPALLYTGRLHPTKGCDLAIRALGLLRRRGVAATLTLAGRGDFSEEARLRAVAAEEDVDRHVRWLGFVPRSALPEIYRAHDAFLFPSRWAEPAGLTYLEAMACGIPVVALARGGAAELLQDGVNAIVCEDEAGLCDGVERLIASPTRARAQVAAGLVTVRSRAALAGYVEAIEEELALAAGSTSASRARSARRVHRAVA
jgi:glycosyltransferase involved in cell wall biosynthesis